MLLELLPRQPPVERGVGLPECLCLPSKLTILTGRPWAILRDVGKTSIDLFVLLVLKPDAGLGLLQERFFFELELPNCTLHTPM